MTTHEGRWAAGTPCWVDLTSDDIATSRDFYGELFGWQWEVGPAEFGHYSTARSDGRRVAGVATRLEGAPAPAWQTYLATDDVQTSADLVAAHGGTVGVPPTEIPGQGWFCMAGDPAGATVGFWQGGDHPGFEACNEPGAVVWNELRASDPAAAQRFFAAVAGLGLDPMPGAPDDPYRMIAVPGADQWLTYFSVDDVDAATATAVRLGGTLVGDPHDAPFGRWSTIQGPGGEVLALHQTPTDAA